IGRTIVLMGPHAPSLMTSPNATPASTLSVPATPAFSLALASVMEQGQNLERRGQRGDARALYEAALVRHEESDPAASATLQRWIARTYMQESDFPIAEDWARRALAASESRSDEAGRGHAINMVAVIRWSQGELDEAEQLFMEARACALGSGEARLAAMTAMNLGNISTVRGDYAEALRYHESSLADARTGGLADEAMKALNNLGLLHTQMSRFDLAARSFSEALELGKLLGDLSTCIVAYLNVARLRLRQDDRAGALAACDEATALARQLGDTNSDGESAHIYGIIARAAGDAQTAETHFLRAESAAIERGDIILQGETARELADLYRHQGRNRQTLMRLNQAHRHFAHLRARRELADVGRRTAKLEGDFLDVVNKWGDSIESKDVYTQGHCVRVADLACALWSRVCAEDDTSLFWFRIGALLHDVGKLMVPAEVLNKPGKLDDDEWLMIRGHPSAGVELLADIEFPWDVRPIVESHHERWDGKGYPHNLMGESIPLTARVLCIADVYDALTSERSYKQPFSHDKAMEIMRGDVGRAFDPGLFGSFEEVVQRGSWRHI
ncbi:MAG: diguanylate cyclase, partial [Gemmatimonadetes bacterium]|nr:diguanylate cyclase [Gemmatimonadota bacterium]